MKNKMIWVSLILVAGLLVWYLRAGLQVERVLPAHPVVFVRLNHVEKHMDQFIHSDFGKNISSIDFAEVLARNNFSPRDIRDFDRWQKGLAQCWANPWVRRFLGKEASVGLYRQNDSYQVLITLRLSPSTRLLEILGQLSGRWGDDAVLTKHHYHGRVINQIAFKKEGLKLAYVRLRDLLIIAPGPARPLEDVIDVYQRRHEALQLDASYNFVRSNAYAKAEAMVFVNFELFSGLWRGEMDSRLTTIGYQSSAFPVYGLSYMPGEVSKYKMIIGLNEKNMPSDMRKAFACPALSNDTLTFVPADAIAYHWGGCYDFDRSWNMAKQRLQANPEFDATLLRLKQRLEEHFNVNIRQDILPLLGNEVGGYLTDVDMQGSYPFPRFLVFVKIKDRSKAEHLLDQLTQNSIRTVRTEEYEHVKIHYVTLSLGGNMDPGYGFLGDYLLLATSRQLIKRSIEAYNDSLRSMVSDNSVLQFSLANGEKFHSVTLMKTAEVSRRAQDFLGWLDKYLSGQVSMAAAYREDGDNKKHQLDEAIADKSAELVLAQKKLTQLKSGSLADISMESPDILNGAIANLNREESSIREDIASYKEQKQDLNRLLDNYALGAQSDKLTMYNMDNIISPLLKGLESIDAEAVTVRVGDKVLETEFLVK